MDLLKQLMANSILCARATGRLKAKAKPTARLNEDDMREAWKELAIWKLGPSWVHSMSGRVFVGGTPKAVWCEEMDERYGE